MFMVGCSRSGMISQLQCNSMKCPPSRTACQQRQQPGLLIRAANALHRVLGTRDQWKAPSRVSTAYLAGLLFRRHIAAVVPRLLKVSKTVFMCLCVRGFIDSKHLKSFLPPPKLTVPFAENGWLEDVCFLLGIFPFLGTFVNAFGGVSVFTKSSKILLIGLSWYIQQKKDLKPFNPPAKSHTSHPVVSDQSDQKCECPGEIWVKITKILFPKYTCKSLKSLKSSEARHSTNMFGSSGF